MTKYLTLTTVVFLFGFLGHTNSQENLPNTEEALETVSNVINNLNISTNTDLNNLNDTVIHAIDGGKNFFKQKCDKNGGPNAYDNAQTATKNWIECLNSFVNRSKLEAEMEKYKPTGDLDIVFKKYCQKTPVLKKCISDLTDAIEPCLEPEERKNKKIVQNITDSLLNFVCYKEGDRIALFISADGPQCLESKQQEAQQCVSTIFGSYMPAGELNNESFQGLDNLPPLVLGTKECKDITNLQNCVVKELEKCSDPTPANIVDSIFKYILKVTPCQNLGTSSNAASTSTISLLVITATVFSILRFT